ncbi:hypothetical protein NIES22_73700 (plasmid) [Calothrix brevissima NIES-22]|nr:hypothetical protein NIES22_73700 [Calothrix brevissima NIES-22]
MLETIACFYSYENCQFVIGRVDEKGNLLVSGGGFHRKITLTECAKFLVNLSGFHKPIWINKHEPLKRSLKQSVSGEVDFKEEDQELQDLFQSLRHEKKIKMLDPNLEAVKSELPLALRILVKALLMELSYGGFVGGVPENCVVQLGGEMTEAEKIVKMWDDLIFNAL